MSIANWRFPATSLVFRTKTLGFLSSRHSSLTERISRWDDVFFSVCLWPGTTKVWIWTCNNSRLLESRWSYSWGWLWPSQQARGIGIDDARNCGELLLAKALDAIGRLHEFSRHRKACLIDAYSLSEEVGFPWQNKVGFWRFPSKVRGIIFAKSSSLYQFFFQKFYICWLP